MSEYKYLLYNPHSTSNVFFIEPYVPYTLLVIISIFFLTSEGDKSKALSIIWILGGLLTIIIPTLTGGYRSEAGLEAKQKEI